MKNFFSFRSWDNEQSYQLSPDLKYLFDIKMLASYCSDQVDLVSSQNFVRHHDRVTVLQMDIVGFTSMSKEIGALKVMSMLNQLYLQFDQLCESLGVYKVETIGDCYVAAGGLETEDTHQADRVLMMAIGIQNIASSVRYPNGSGRTLNVRIGIHSGPVTSGLMGKSQKRYSLFGKAIKTVGQIEQSCPISYIQVSDIAYQQLSYTWHKYGKKNDKSTIQCYCFDWKDLLINF
eukprot:TRINITY_DN13420_c0_g1_i1.p1 TRINITY_DN13420_c0_g1~~TRINITY_DN13420_c0_g1_i1.p1  ORF type:complete len:233 (-),score=7.57 TRINITY_DN13420_c0_g1_i1:310-1008(-)